MKPYPERRSIISQHHRLNLSTIEGISLIATRGKFLITVAGGLNFSIGFHSILTFTMLLSLFISEFRHRLSPSAPSCARINLSILSCSRYVAPHHQDLNVQLALPDL